MIDAVKTAAAAFFGVRRQSKHEQDTAGIRPVHIAATAIVLVVLPVFRGTYEDQLRWRVHGLWDTARRSHEAAQALNERVVEGQNVLITSMYYNGDTIRVPCPIFVHYLKDMPVLVRHYADVRADNFVDTVRANRIDWAMISPEPGPAADALIQVLRDRHGLVPHVCAGALIYRTTTLRESPGAATSP